LNKVTKLNNSKFWWANKEVKQVATSKPNIQLPTFQTFQYPTKLPKRLRKGSSSKNHDLRCKGEKCEIWATFKLHIEFYYVSNLELLFQEESLARLKI